jgi:hypothetical protein
MTSDQRAAEMKVTADPVGPEKGSDQLWIVAPQLAWTQRRRRWVGPRTPIASSVEVTILSSVYQSVDGMDEDDHGASHAWMVDDTVIECVVILGPRGKTSEYLSSQRRTQCRGTRSEPDDRCGKLLVWKPRIPLLREVDATIGGKESPRPARCLQAHSISCRFHLLVSSGRTIPDKLS